MLIIKHNLPYFGFLIAVLAILFIPKVDSIECSNNAQTCTPEVTKYLDTVKNSRIFFLDHQKFLAEKHHQTLPFKILRIEKILPSTLHFELENLAAVYKLTTTDTNETFGISADGSFVPIENSAATTQIFISKNSVNPELGGVNPTVNTTVISILSAVPKTRRLERIVYISPQEIQLFFTQTPLILVAEPIPVYALQHLDSILYTVEQTPLELPSKEIDLRFSLPVLRTEG